MAKQHTRSKGVESLGNNGGNRSLLFDGGVDIVEAFWVGCYSEGSHCLIQASVGSVDIYTALIRMRAKTDYMCWISHHAGWR